MGEMTDSEIANLFEAELLLCPCHTLKAPEAAKPKKSADRKKTDAEGGRAPQTAQSLEHKRFGLKEAGFDFAAARRSRAISAARSSARTSCSRKTVICSIC